MNDALCEHIVARKSKPMDFIIRILIIVVIVAVAIVGLPFLGFFAFALAAILALLAYYFAFPLLNVEYEYSLLNHDLDIDAILQQREKKIQNELRYSECRDYCTKKDLTDWTLIIQKQLAIFHPEMQMQRFSQS